MECPVCNKKDLPDDETRCPNCNADLEALQVSKKINKDSRNRLSFGIIMSVLFLAVLVIWILTGMTQKEPNATPAESTVTEDVSSELSNVKMQNETLRTENKNLKQQLAELQKQKAERTKEYVVQNGESLYLIARKIYGNGYKYIDLAKDNNISNPDQIQTGQTLIIYY